MGNNNLEIIRSDLGKFDTGYINLSNNSICIENREYKQEFYFKNPEYIKHLNLNSNE